MKFTGFLTVLLFSTALYAAPADPPQWWTEGNPPLINAAPENNLGPANIGQAKNFVLQALDAIRIVEPQTAALILADLTEPQPNDLAPGQFHPAILDLSAPFAPADEWLESQKAPLLLGQLKAMSAPFYKRLHAALPVWLDRESETESEKGQLQLNGTKDPLDPDNFYPWTSASGDDANRAIATVGQLKAVFSLRFEGLAQLDSDGDGMPDLWEYANGLDPHSAANATLPGAEEPAPGQGPLDDLDGDGVLNIDELDNSTAPNDASDFPPLIEEIHKWSHQQSTSPEPEHTDNWILYMDTWSITPSPIWQGDSSVKTISQLHAAIGEVKPFPSVVQLNATKYIPSRRGVELPPSLYGRYSGSAENGPFTSVVSILRRPRLWMKISPKMASTKAQKIPYLLVWERREWNYNSTIIGEMTGPTIVDISVVEFEFPADASRSAPLDIETKLFGGAVGKLNESTYRLIPIEYVNSKKERVTKLRVATLSEPGVLYRSTGGPELVPDKDSDRFHVMIPGGAFLGAATVKLSTYDNPSADYDDNATEIDLEINDGDLISKSMVLVSDDVDDDHPVDNIADDDKNDRTHKIQLGGGVKLSSVKVGSREELEIEATADVVKKKTVSVRLVNCRGTTGSLLPAAWSAQEIARTKRTLLERFAQAEIDFEFSNSIGPRLNSDAWMNHGTYPSPHVYGGLMHIPEETKEIFDGEPNLAYNEIGLYLVRKLAAPGSYPYGVAIPRKFLSLPDQNAGYGYKAFIGDFESTYSRYFTTSHEMMHILLDAAHEDYEREHKDRTMLFHTTLFPTTNGNASIAEPKRISERQRKKILEHPFMR